MSEETNNEQVEEVVEESKEEKKDSPLESAQEAVNKLTELNDRFEANLLRAEEIRATELLSGQAEAGRRAKEKVESPTEYVDKVLAGSLNGNR